MHKLKKLVYILWGVAIATPIFALSGSLRTTDLTLSQRVTQLESQIGSQLNLQQQIHALKEDITRQNHILSMLQQRVSQLGSIVSPETKASAMSGANSSVFNNAYDFILHGNYEKAITELQTYLKQYPKGSDAPAAHYWLGEINMLTGNSGVAAKEFRLVVSDFPKSQKAPESLRLLGTIFLSNGDSQHAKKTFEAVVKRYPSTASAILAKKSLASMK